MSVRWFELEPVPSVGWLKRKKVCGWLLERADPQSLPVTLDSGRLELRYADLNNLGARGRRDPVPPGAYRLGIEQIEPGYAKGFPRWRVTLGQYEVIVTKSSADQWRFFELFSGCEPLCATVTKTRVTLYYACEAGFENPTYPEDRI